MTTQQDPWIKTYRIIKEWDGLYYVGYALHFGEPGITILKKSEYSNEVASFKSAEEAKEFAEAHFNNRESIVVSEFCHIVGEPKQVNWEDKK